MNFKEKKTEIPTFIKFFFQLKDDGQLICREPRQTFIVEFTAAHQSVSALCNRIKNFERKSMLGNRMTISIRSFIVAFHFLAIVI